MTYLVTEHGKPSTAPGFGNKFRDWCDQAGLHHCSAHGIRKFDATAAAEKAPRRISSWPCSAGTASNRPSTTRAKPSQQKLATGAVHLLTT